VPTRLGWLGVAVASFLLVPASGALAACEGGDAEAGSVSARAYARSVRCALNEQRAQSGLAPLAEDRRLTRAASRYSHSMVSEGFFAHVSPAGSTLGQRARAAGFAGSSLGETIAWGSGELGTPAAIVDQLMHSPPHRAISLDRRFRRVGLGVASGSPEGADGGATVTADFGA
jgi:uncharacterized protein YkwD